MVSGISRWIEGSGSGGIGTTVASVGRSEGGLVVWVVVNLGKGSGGGVAVGEGWRSG